MGASRRQLARCVGRRLLVDSHADIIVLVESYWEWIDQDPAILARYPHCAALAWNADRGVVLRRVEQQGK